MTCREISDVLFQQDSQTLKQLFSIAVNDSLISAVFISELRYHSQKEMNIQWRDLN